ncbi:hypothetical protein GQ44DRAFT_711314 [Phaeosphaeriaceae sp. PMI808]|nr:hypothetical protein GQ44DRAFT_711314 [Phaeosphaeriaceae sp. PMI808]
MLSWLKLFRLPFSRPLGITSVSACAYHLRGDLVDVDAAKELRMGRLIPKIYYARFLRAGKFSSSSPYCPSSPSPVALLQDLSIEEWLKLLHLPARRRCVTYPYCSQL